MEKPIVSDSASGLPFLQRHRRGVLALAASCAISLVVVTNAVVGFSSRQWAALLVRPSSSTAASVPQYGRTY